MSDNYHGTWSDDDSNEFEFDNAPEGDDVDFDDEIDDPDDDVIACPVCHREVHELADRCPHCGEYITFGNQPWAYQSKSRQRIIKWALLLMIGALLLPFVLAIWRMLMTTVGNE